MSTTATSTTATSTTQTPAADATTAPTPLPPDSGHPVQAGPNLWLRADGSSTTHNGLGPVEVPPPANRVDRLLKIRRYHLAKLELAWDGLRAVRRSKLHGCGYRWDRVLWGPLPKCYSRGGVVADEGASDERLSAICWHHDKALKEADRTLRELGVEPA